MSDSLIESFFHPTPEHRIEHLIDYTDSTFFMHLGRGLARVDHDAELFIDRAGVSLNIGKFILRQDISRSVSVWDLDYLDRNGVRTVLLIGDTDLLRAERTAFKHLIDTGLIESLTGLDALVPKSVVV